MTASNSFYEANKGIQQMINDIDRFASRKNRTEPNTDKIKNIALGEGNKSFKPANK